MPRKLKVFRTPTGFHDAYVAAPSRKAALAAWGAEADLFARGTAEEVTDARLTAEPLAHPGEVIRVSRGDLAAQLKALGPRKKSTPKSMRGSDTRALSEASSKSKPKPPPKRDRLDKAEAAITALEAKHSRERALLERQRDALDHKLGALESRQEKEIARLEAARDKAKAAYRAALDKWSG